MRKNEVRGKRAMEIKVHAVRETYLRTRSEIERGLAVTLLRRRSGAGGGVDICLLGGGFQRLLCVGRKGEIAFA